MLPSTKRRLYDLEGRVEQLEEQVGKLSKLLGAPGPSIVSGAEREANAYRKMALKHGLPELGATFQVEDGLRFSVVGWVVDARSGEPGESTAPVIVRSSQSDASPRKLKWPISHAKWMVENCERVDGC